MPINWQALMNMQMSDDKAQQALASKAASKLTPQEQQEFFDFQVKRNGELGHGGEKDRADANVLKLGQFGLQPEELVGGGLAAKAMGVPAYAASTVKGLGAGYVTDEIGKALGLPAPLRYGLDALFGYKASGAKLKNGSIEFGGASPAGKILPQTDEEFLASTGRARGTFRSPSSPPKLKPPSSTRLGPLKDIPSENATEIERVTQGGAKVDQVELPRPTEGTGPSKDALPLNVERTRSAADDVARAKATGGNPDSAAHRAGGEMRKGAQVEGDSTYDAYEEARKIKSKVRSPKK